MNDLNSILIEGKMDGVLYQEEDHGRFVLTSSRTERKENGDLEIVKDKFDIWVYGSQKIACESYIKKDSYVRVVGRLRNDFDCRAYVLAEFIEYKTLSQEIGGKK